jgi:toxin ParE1/3/4
MKIIVHESAARDLDGIFDWISKDSPGAAAELVRRVQLRINRLAVAGLAHMGRPGLVEGTRELLETPYIIFYSVDEAAGAIEVIAIVHGARDRQA